MQEQANMLRKDKQFKEAGDLYSVIIEKSGDKASQWDLWGLAYCLYKLNNYEESFALCEKIFEKDQEFEPVISLLGWNYYNLYVKNYKEVKENKFFAAVSKILMLFKQDDEYSPLALTIFKAIDALSLKRPVPYEQIINYLLLLNPDLLDNKNASYKSKRGVTIQLPSQKEKYYSNYIKALRGTERNEEAIIECDKALESIENMSLKSKNWFLKNKALAISNLKRNKEALDILLALGNDWTVLLEIAQIYEKEHEYKKALNYAIQCALVKIDPSLKVKCYMQIVRMLKRLNDTQAIADHLELTCLIYNKHKWKLNNEIKDLCREYNVHTVSKNTIDSLYSKLRNFWDNYTASSQELFSGVISKVFQDKHYGYISSNDNSYFFSEREFKGDKHYLKAGTRVIFNIIDAFDKKNNKPVKNAVNVNIVKNN